MKRILIIAVLLVVLIVGGAVIAPGFVDWNKYKPQILTQLNNATGHDYKIDGPIDLAVLPFPHVSIGKLSVAVDGTSLVTLDKASVQLALMPLFSGEIIVNSVLLQKPVFTAEIAADGTPSWMTPALQQKMGKKQGDAAPGSGLGNAVALNEIAIKDGSVRFTDKRSGQNIALDDINLELEGESLYGPYSLEGGFVYDSHKTKVKLDSGRIDKLAESLSTQLELAFPDLSSTLRYSGVVVLKDKVLEMQGETGIETPDLGALMAISGQPALDYLVKKPLSLKGILTFEGNEAAYRNMKFAFAGLEGSGSAVVKNFAKDAKAPLDLNIALETSKAFVVEKFLPPAGGQKAGSGFLPETVTLPRDVRLALSLKAGGVQYRGMNFQDVAFSLDSKEKGFSSQLNMKAPGNSSVDVNSLIAFGAKSKSSQNGAVSLSDPRLALDAKMTSEEPSVLAKALDQKALTPPVMNLLAHKLNIDTKVDVTPRRADIKDLQVKLAETKFSATGRYDKASGGGRDQAKLALANYGLDADYWIKKLGGSSAADAAAVQKRPDPRDFTKNIALPFDLDFIAEIQSLHFQGRDYSKLAAKGRLTGAQLRLQGLELISNAGDSFVVTGGIKDIQSFGGTDFSVQVDLVDTQATLQSFGVDTTRLPASIGKSQVVAELKGTPEKMAFTTNLKAMRATLEASGAVADALAAPKVSDLTLRLQHPSYVEVARIYKPNFNSGVAIKKNLDVFASMSRKGDVYTFSQLQAIIGPANIKGDVVADVSGSKPAITAALEISDLPVDDLMGIRTANTTTTKPRTAKSSQDVRWSRNAIDAGALQLANVELKATARSISYGNWDFTNAGINIDLKDGNVDIKQLDGGLYGGHVAMTGSLKSSSKERQPLSFAGEMLAQDVDLEQFVSSFSGSKLMQAKGVISLESKVQTTGISPAALVFDLGGKGTAKGQDITFEGFDLARLSRSLANPTSSFTENFGRVLDATMQGGTTHFDKLDGAFTITEGVIHFDKMDLTGADADVATRGTVSLPLWSLDLESTVQLKEPKDSPPLRASFKGPLDKPAQTFGQNAMQQYFMNQIQGTILTPNSGKINKTLDKLDSSGTLKTLLGVPEEKKPVPQIVPEKSSGSAPVQPEQPVQQQVAPTQQPSQQQMQQKPKEITPEEAIFGVIQGVLGGQ